MTALLLTIIAVELAYIARSLALQRRRLASWDRGTTLAIITDDDTPIESAATIRADRPVKIGEDVRA